MTFKQILPSLLGTRRNRGVALIITLGILALMLILVMSFAFDARSTAQAAVAQSDIARSRLMARSGLERALGFLQQEFTNPGDGSSTFMSPASAFFTPSSGSWQDITLLPSADITFPAGFSDSAMDALYVEYLRMGTSGDTGFFTYTDTIAGSVGWYAVATTVDSSTDGSMSSQDSEILGRVIYTIMARDLWNPAVLTNATVDDGAAAGNGYTRLGATIDDVSLMDVLGDAALSQRFHPTTHSTVNGKRADVDWLSYRQIFRDTVNSQADADLVTKNLFPHSVTDGDLFWNDVNSDSIVDSGELISRMNLADVTADSGVAIYNFLTGQAVTPGRNDLTTMVPWIRERAANATAGRRMAAQLAMYMVDWVDTDAQDLDAGTYKPTVAVVSGTGNHDMVVQSGDAGLGANVEAVLYGNEKEPALLDFQVKLQYESIGASTNSRASIWVRASVIFPYTTDLPYQVELRSSGASYELLTTLGFTNITDNLGALTLTSGSELTGPTINSSASEGSNTAYIYQSDWVQWGASTVGTAFKTSGPNWYISKLWINPVQIYTMKTAASNYRLAKSYPRKGTGTDGAGTPSSGNYFARITESALVLHDLTTDADYFASFTPKDPVATYAGNSDAEYTDQWTTAPAVPGRNGAVNNYRVPYAMDDSGTEPTWTARASRNNPLASTSANPYGGLVGPPDVPFTSLKELGQLHSSAPLDSSTWHGINRTNRFWCVGGTGFTSESDIALLDIFTFGNNPRGRLNINTTSENALAGLVAGGPNSDDAAVVTAILNTNGKTGGSPYVRRSEIIKAINDAGGGVFPDGYGDQNAEFYAGVAANLCDTQFNYFTIIVTAQSMKDIGTWQDTDPPPSTLKAIKWKDNGGGSGKYGIIHSESRLIADLVRNAYTNEINVIRVEALEE